MPQIDDPNTRQALREIGCLVEDRLDTKAFTLLLAERLEAEHMAHTVDEVPAVEITVGQLVNALTGSSDEQLIDLCKPLLAGGASGPVQKALSDGHWLCAGRARIDVNIAGEHKTSSVGTRFLSADHDVLERYVLEPRRRRGESFMTSTVEMAELMKKRQPGMAPRVGSFIDQLTATWQKMLPKSDAA